MSKPHIDFIRAHLLAVIRKATKTDAAHPNPAVIRSVNDRILMASQALRMLNHIDIDYIGMAADLQMPHPAHWSLLSERERMAWARNFVENAGPKRKGADDDE